MNALKKPNLLSYLGRGLMILVIICLAAAPVAVQAQEPDPVEESSEIVATPSGAWTLYQVDGGHNFLNLTDRALRFDSNGNPHVVYGGKNLYYTYYNGTTWNLSLVDAAPGVGEYAALALDSSNRPRISYYDATNRSLKFAYWDGAAWHITTVDTPLTAMGDLLPSNLHHMLAAADPYRATAYPENAVGLYTSIAVDANNGVHITYYDTTAYGNPNNPYGVLKYAYWNGVTWSFDTIDDRNNVGVENSLAIKPGTTLPCVSYLIELYDDLRYACKQLDGDWKVETVDGSVDQNDPPKNVGSFSSLAFDSNGNPHISYYDFSSGDLKYAYKKSDSWTRSAIDTSGDAGTFTSIAVNKSNRVYISYIDETNGNLNQVDSSDWVPEKVTSLGNLGGRYTSIAIDKNGRQGIVYYRIDTAKLYYTHWGGSSWTTTTLDTAADLGLGSSLDVNNYGTPYLSYVNTSSADLKYAYPFYNVWKTTTILGSGYYVGAYSSLELDSAQRPLIASYDASNGNLKLSTWNGSAWELRTADDSDNNVGQYLSLAVDSQNRAHISYFDATAHQLKYAYWNGSAWIRQVVDTGDPGNRDVGRYTSIALDSANRPYISYFDATDGDLMLAYKSPIDAWVIEEVDTAGTVGQYTAIDVDDYDTVHITYYDSTNGNLKYAEKVGGDWYLDVVDSAGNTGLYTSIVVDAFGLSYISYYDASSGALKFASGSYTSWWNETVDSDGVTGLYTSIGLNSAGQPAISYYDYSSGELWLAMSYALPLPPYSIYMPKTDKNR